MFILPSRKGIKRNKEQIRREIMRQATTRAENKYTLGGGLKEGRHKPKPVTLPSLTNRKD